MMSRDSKGLRANFDEWRRTLSLREKLIFLISGVSLVVVSISMFASFGIELYLFRNRLMDEYSATARLVGSNLEAAIVFEDRRDSEEILGKLDRYVDVETAGLYLSDNQLLASYFKDASESGREVLPWDSETHFYRERIVVNEPVLGEEGDFIGRIILEANLGEMRSYLFARFGVFGALLLFAVLFAILLARRLGHYVSRPIVELTTTANRIARDHDFSARPVRLTDDETGQLVDAFNEMMTQIQTRDEVIRSSEKRFRDYFDLGVVGAGILDTKFCWLEANNQILEMLQCSFEYLDGVPLWNLLPEGVLGLTLEQFSRTPGGGGDRVATREYWLKCKHGTFVYFLISMRYVPSTKYLSEHILLMAQDITNRKRYEEGILKAKEDAEASSKAKDEFLSVISHELRTPLNPIIGYVDLLLQERDDVEDPIRLGLVKRSAQHLLELIDDVLDYSRIERGVITFNQEIVNYEALCANVISLLGRTLKGKEVELFGEHTIEISDLSCNAIIIDRVKFRQVLLNLVSNAIKFTLSGKILLRTTLRHGGQNHIVLRVEVEDSGIGIDEVDHDRVFKAFSQIDSSLTRRHSGMGLGLAISKKIVDAFGGDLDFKSRKGVGSNFWFEIPVTLSEQEEPEQVIRKKVERAKSAEYPVLLVEDEPINLELARSLLKRAGQEVVCAHDGQEAVELASQSEFSLIIMDVRMPRMDGLEATREIRKLEKGQSRTPIIAVSAHATNSDEKECFDAGMDDYLPKPLDIQKLNTLIEDWL